MSDTITATTTTTTATTGTIADDTQVTESSSTGNVQPLKKRKGVSIQAGMVKEKIEKVVQSAASSSSSSSSAAAAAYNSSNQAFSNGSATTLLDLCNMQSRKGSVKRGKKSADDKATAAAATKPNKIIKNTKSSSNISQQQQQVGPQVEMINGKMTIKESSLVVHNELENSNVDFIEVTEGVYATATYSSFLNRKTTAPWNNDETRLFYQCLRQCGTDFTMMQSFFPNRTRKQLKRKYYREEKGRPELLKKAMNSYLPLSIAPFTIQYGNVDHEIDNDPTNILNVHLNSSSRDGSAVSTTDTIHRTVYPVIGGGVGVGSTVSKLPSTRPDDDDDDIDFIDV